MAPPASPPQSEPPDEFRPCASAPGYCVSRSGRAFSSVQSGAWRQLKPQSRRRDLWVFVKHEAGAHWRKVGELVAEEFLGPKPSPGHCVLFVNKMRWDTSAGNLRWATIEEARTYYVRRGEQCKRGKLTAAAVVDLRKKVYAATLAGVPFNWSAEAEARDCTEANLRAAAAGETWKHVDAGVPLWERGGRLVPSNKKLTEDEARRIKIRLRNGESPQMVAPSYPHVSLRCIIAIADGDIWKHVTI